MIALLLAALNGVVAFARGACGTPIAPKPDGTIGCGRGSRDDVFSGYYTLVRPRRGVHVVLGYAPGRAGGAAALASSFRVR
jgi:hypothetical protein